MIMYKNILYATDLSTEHSHLTAKAAKIAKQLKAKLFLLHVIELPASVQLAQGLGFTELAHPVKDDAQTVLSLVGESYNIPAKQLFVEIGSVKEQIIKKATELDCQLIIIGSHSPGALNAIMGSSAQAIVYHATCDVLTLKA